MPALTRRKLVPLAFGLALVAAFTLPFLRPSPPAPRYTIADLGVLPGGTDSHAYGLNAQGVVCGYTQIGFSERPCVFGNGKVTALIVPPGVASSDAISINAHGEVTGRFNWPNPMQAFLLSGGSLRNLGTLPGYSGSQGNAINEWGEVTGAALNYAARPGTSFKHAFFYSHGKMTDLGTLPGATDSAAYGLNGVGQIVGDCRLRRGASRTPFLYDTHRKTMTALPMPTTYILCHAYAINDHGQIAGQFVCTTGKRWLTHAALWSGGRFTDLGAPTGYDNASAESLNSRGDVVGQCYQEPTAFQAFLQSHAGHNNAWQRYVDRGYQSALLYRNGRMQDLNTLIPKEDGWTLEEARCINDRGQIAGTGLHNGLRRAFLLTPR